MARLGFKRLLAGRTTLAFASLLVAFVLFLAVNVLSQAGLTGARLDLTRDKLFTLSQGTRAILRKIDEPITLRFYFSTRLGKELPAFAKYAGRVRGLLREYAALAGDKIRLLVADPVPFSEAEDAAVAFGLQGIPLDQTGEMVYFGLAGTNSTDDEEAIAFFAPDRERFLEYDLTKMVFKLSNPKRTVVGLMTSLPLRGSAGTMMAPIGPLARPWQVIGQLEQLFEVRTIDPDIDEDIPEGVDVLMLVHPAKLPERTLYAVDQYLMAGGRALIFVDPLAEAVESLAGPGATTIPPSSNLERLFGAWGIEMVEDKAVGDRLSARRVNAGTADRLEPVDYLAWIALGRPNFEADDLVTGEIDAINLASAGALNAKPGAEANFTPLITSSEQAMLIEVDKLKGTPDFYGLLRDFKPADGRFTLAARISGPLESAFPDGPPRRSGAPGRAGGPPEEKDEKKGEKAQARGAAEEKEKPGPDKTHQHLKRSKGPINVIVVADTDLLRDRFWVQVQEFFGQTIALPLSDNMNFVINALDNLAGSNDLIGLRSRGVSQRPFERVVQLARAAEIRLRGKERELRARREETEKKLQELQRPGQATGGTVILTPAQLSEINKFKGELLAIRKELRAVQLDLRRDIETLESRLWFVNIALIPILVAAAALVLGLLRIGRRRQRMETEALG